MAAVRLVDTHCHIHESDYEIDPDQAIHDAKIAGVVKAICVGTSLDSSKRAVDFVLNRDNLYCSIGLHPHYADEYQNSSPKLKEFDNLIKKAKVVAIGECGLDYFYNNSSKASQKKLLHHQIELALDSNLPLIFHVRNAFNDFWKIVDEYKGIRGVIHSFSSNQKDLDQILSRGLYVGLNGIVTFTKDPEQLAAARQLPLASMVLETDAPFLTPTPYRGTICQPMHVRVIAEFLSKARGESLEDLADVTTSNATNLFGLKGAENE